MRLYLAVSLSQLSSVFRSIDRYHSERFSFFFLFFLLFPVFAIFFSSYLFSRFCNVCPYYCCWKKLRHQSKQFALNEYSWVNVRIWHFDAHWFQWQANGLKFDNKKYHNHQMECCFLRSCSFIDSNRMGCVVRLQFTSFFSRKINEV